MDMQDLEFLHHPSGIWVPRTKRPTVIDLFCGCGGFSEGFSYAGRRNVMDPRNSLVFEFARMVLEIRPKALVFENVPGIETMVTPDGVPVLDAVSLMLQEGGWGLWESIKTTLLTTSGAGAAIIGKPRPRRGKDADPEDDTERRPSLFDRALEAMA